MPICRPRGGFSNCAGFDVTSKVMFERLNSKNKTALLTGKTLSTTFIREQNRNRFAVELSHLLTTIRRGSYEKRFLKTPYDHLRISQGMGHFFRVFLELLLTTYLRYTINSKHTKFRTTGYQLPITSTMINLLANCPIIADILLITVCVH